MLRLLVGWIISLFSGRPTEKPQTSMNPVTQVYYFPVRADGSETGESILVDLNADGSANLSRLPAEVRSRLEHGIPNELRTGTFSPKDGSAFLLALLRSTNGYTRFRTNAV